MLSKRECVKKKAKAKEKENASAEADKEEVSDYLVVSFVVGVVLSRTEVCE